MESSHWQLYIDYQQLMQLESSGVSTKPGLEMSPDVTLDCQAATV